MSENFENDAQLSMEERLTAVLMGEADEATIKQVEAALEVDPDLRARRDSMVHTLGLIKDAPPMPGVSGLNDARRDVLRDAAQQQLRPRLWRPSPLLSAAALLLVVSGVAFLNQDKWLESPADVHAGAPDMESLGYVGRDISSETPSGAVLPPIEMKSLDKLGYGGGSGGGLGADKGVDPSRLAKEGVISLIEAENAPAEESILSFEPSQQPLADNKKAKAADSQNLERGRFGLRESLNTGVESQIAAPAPPATTVPKPSTILLYSSPPNPPSAGSPFNVITLAILKYR